MMRCSELERECAKYKHENQQMRDTIATMANDNTSESPASVSALKAIIKQLEKEREEYKEVIQQLMNEIDLLKNNNNRQKQFIGISSASIQSNGSGDVITKVGQQNTLLKEKCDKLLNENKHLKMELMRRKLFENNGSDNKIVAITDDNCQNNMKFIGLFEYAQQNEALILKMLITDLQPSVALKFQAHLPAYILFMCIRYTDHINDETQVRNLLNNTIMSIKRTIKQNQNIESHVMWLSNTCELLTCLRQYSGEESFGIFAESLKNFDLSEYRQMFSDIAVWIYQRVIKQSEQRIQSLIVPAVLEYESIDSSAMHSQPSIQRTGSVSEDTLAPFSTEKPIEALIKELSYLNRILILHVIEPDIIHQIFKQLFYFICAHSLNNLLLRKDLCDRNKAMQIVFNLLSLEQWCREQQIPKWNDVVEKLDPLIQTTKLLQTRKTEEHIPTIVKMCNKLNCSQIIKILDLSTAGDEQRISNTFIKKVQQHICSERKADGPYVTLLMDTKYSFALTIPYIPCDVILQNITLPAVLVENGLAIVLKKV